MNKKYKILIVDDNPELRELLQSMLNLRGYSAEGTGNAYEVEILAADTKDAPDVIILDMLLTGMDGCDLCRSLKFNASTQQIPVIMISAYPFAEEMCLAAGADDFLIKPFSIDQLTSLLRSHLSTREKIRA